MPSVLLQPSGDAPIYLVFYSDKERVGLFQSPQAIYADPMHHVLADAHVGLPEGFTRSVEVGDRRVDAAYAGVFSIPAQSGHPGGFAAAYNADVIELPGGHPLLDMDEWRQSSQGFANASMYFDENGTGVSLAASETDRVLISYNGVMSRMDPLSAEQFGLELLRMSMIAGGWADEPWNKPLIEAVSARTAIHAAVAALPDDE